MAQYPEHEKLNMEQLRTMDILIEWLQSKGYSICKLDYKSVKYADWRKLRAEFFGTTEKALEKERQEMLKELSQ